MINVSFTYIIITFALLFSTKADMRVSEIWDIDKSSSMVVIGETNVNSFECALGSYDWNNNLVCYQSDNSSKKKYTIFCDFEIPVKSFDCGMNLITKDLRKTLKSDHHPFMNIRLKEMSDLISNVRNGENIETKTDIILTGIKKQSSINFKVNKTDNNYISLEGKKIIQLSEYNLTPPSRFLGSVQVKDQLTVNIKIRLRKANS
jgi:hypothetical protein